MPPRPTLDVAGRDVHWMSEALRLAHRGLGHTPPNPPVGCVIVANGAVVGAGYHRRTGMPHAEAEALRVAGERARGATAYVTLEPCSHQGRTPPCARGLLDAGVRRVVVGSGDPNPLVAGRGLRTLRRGGVHVCTGVLATECEELIRGFRSWVTLGRPWVHLKLAASLDGRIAARTGISKWISSAESRMLVQRMRARAGAILVGAGTVLADDPRLTCRLPGAASPLRVVLDPKLRVSPDARVVRAPGQSLVICGSAVAARRRRVLERAGAETMALDTRGPRGWQRLLAELGRRSIHELLIEGGSGVATSAIKAGVVNAMTIFYNPCLIGGDGVPMVGSLGVARPSRALRLRSVRWTASDTDLVWTGQFE